MAQQIRIKTSTGWKVITDVLLNKGNQLWESVENAYVKTSTGWKNVFSSIDVTNRPRIVVGSGPTFTTNSRLGSGEFTQGSVITVTTGSWQRMSASYDPVYYHIKLQVTDNPLNGLSWVTIKESAFSMSVASLTYTITSGDVARPSYYFRAIVYAKNKYGLSGETLPRTEGIIYNPYYLSYKDLKPQFVAQASVYKSTSIAWSYGSGITAADVSKVEIEIVSLNDPNFSEPQTYLLTTSQLTQFGITGNTTPTGNFIAVPNYNPYEYNYYLTLFFYAQDTKQDNEPTTPRDYFAIGPVGNKLPETQDPDIASASIYGPTTITGTNYNWTDLGSYTLNYYFDMATPDPDEPYDYVPISDPDPAVDSPRWNSVSSGVISNPAAGSSNTKTYLAPDPGFKGTTNIPQVNYYRFRVVATKADSMSVVVLSQSPITIEHQTLPPSSSSAPTVSLISGTAGVVGATYRITSGNWANIPTEFKFGFEDISPSGLSKADSGWIDSSNNTWDYTFTTPTTYSMQGYMFARNIGGTSSISYASPTVPRIYDNTALPPTSVTASLVAGSDYNNALINVSWTPASSGATVDYYRIQYAYSSDNYQTWYTWSDQISGTSTQLSGFSAGWTLKVKVWSHSSAGYSTSSTISGAVIITTKPQAPVLNSASKTSNTSLSAAFTALSQLGDGGLATTYYLRAKIVQLPASSAFTKNITGLSSPQSFTGLGAGYSYYLLIRAGNSQGEVDSNTIEVDLREPIPSGGTVSISTNTGNYRVGSIITFSTTGWSGSPTSYSLRLYNGTNPVLTSDPQRGSTVNGTSGTYTIVSDDIPNFFKAFATATNGTGTSTEVGSTQVGPAAAAVVPSPPTITSSSATTNSITLNFTAGANSTTTRAYINGSFDGSTNTGSYTFVGLSAGTSYSLTLFGYDGINLSATSSGGSYSTTSNPALTTTFGTNTRTSNGFTGSITNYNSSYNYTVTVSAGSVSNGTATGNIRPFTVTGLSAGQSATVTVVTTRPGYENGSATTTSSALAAAVTYTFSMGNKISVCTNGYITLGNSSTVLPNTSVSMPTSGSIFVILPKDMKQTSLYYWSNASQYRVRWSGYQFNTPSIIMTYEVTFYNGQQYADVVIIDRFVAQDNIFAFINDSSTISSYPSTPIENSKFRVYFNSSTPTVLATYNPTSTTVMVRDNTSDAGDEAETTLITAANQQAAVAPFFPPYFVPPFFPPYFVPPFFPPYFVPPFFPPYFVPPYFPAQPFFPPYFVPPYFVPPFFPAGCDPCTASNCPEYFGCFCTGNCDYDCYC